MDSQKVDLFLAANQKFFSPTQILTIKDRLLALDDDRFAIINALDYKDPTMMILVAIRLSPYVHKWVRRHEKKGKTRISATLSSAEAIGQFILLLKAHHHLIENMNIKDQGNSETKLTLRCAMNNKETAHELYALLKQSPHILHLEVEN